VAGQLNLLPRCECVRDENGIMSTRANRRSRFAAFAPGARTQQEPYCHMSNFTGSLVVPDCYLTVAARWLAFRKGN